MPSSDSKAKFRRDFKIYVIPTLIVVTILLFLAISYKERKAEANLEKMELRIEELAPGEVLSLDIWIPDKDLIGSSHVDDKLKEGIRQISKKYHIKNGIQKTKGFFSEGAYGLSGTTGYIFFVSPK